jgi:hypothetical protein
LKRCLDSIADKLDYLIAIDGRYDLYYDCNSSGLSFDGSRELVKSYRNGLLLDAPGLPEPEKRQKYVEACASLGIELLLIIDSDEWLECSSSSSSNLDEFYAEVEQKVLGKSSNVYCIMTEKPHEQGQFFAKPRLWYRPGEMTYLKRHYEFKRRRGMASQEDWTHTGGYADILKSVRIRADDSLRSKELIEASNEYQARLIEKERLI